MFKGINAAACFFNNGMYTFSDVEMDDAIAELSSYSSVKCSIPNPQTRECVENLLSNLDHTNVTLNEPGDWIYSFVFESRHEECELIRVTKIEFKGVASQAPPTQVNYVWSNRMMNQQEPGLYTLTTINKMNIDTSILTPQNVKIGHQATLDVFTREFNYNGVDVDRTNYSPLKIGECALIIIPQTSQPIIGGIDLKQVPIVNYLVLTRTG